MMARLTVMEIYGWELCTGSLYRALVRCTASINNSMSKKTRRRYHIERARLELRSHENVFYRYAAAYGTVILFDSATGALQFEKNAVEIDKATGSPDGMCIDEEGMLWVAQWNGFGVYRYNPGTGQLLGKISVPVPQVSACAFGGPELDTMIITTAQENFSEEDKIKYPLSGGLLWQSPVYGALTRKDLNSNTAF